MKTMKKGKKHIIKFVVDISQISLNKEYVYIQKFQLTNPRNKQQIEHV